MSNTNRITADEIKSAVTVSPDYRRAIVNGRRFDMTKTTHRAGHYGRRYTATEWLITERNEDAPSTVRPPSRRPTAASPSTSTTSRGRRCGRED